MRTAPAAALLVCGFLLGCPSTKTPGPASPTPASRSRADGDARLGPDVVPLGYVLDLAIDPRKPGEDAGFSGDVRIAIRVVRSTGRIVLHARDLEISEVTAGPSPAAVEPGINGAVTLSLPAPLPPGEHELRLRFRGPYSKSLGGLYLAGAGEKRAAYTQFEAIDARRAFPCFDEPGFKTPFELTLRVPRGFDAVSNTPIVSTTADGDRDVVRFARTKPLPTYLVAMAVGDFDIVEGAPVDGSPVRFITPKGEGALATYAVTRVAPVLRALTEYFGRPYPYEKIDIVAVPDFWAGAMENAGMITIRDTIVLQDAEHIDLGRRATIELVLAHEIAHQWFGNLVTMEWWNDIWLNEGFASWMHTKIARQTLPEAQLELRATMSTRSVMFTDARPSTRVVRQPVKTGGDVLNMLDGITYTKGMAVIGMLEQWCGEAPFREGVRAYLKEHEWGNATTEDLFVALERSTGKPIREVASTFLDRPGSPLLDVTPRCDGAKGFARVVQTRWLPLGSTTPQGDSWKVPACFRVGLAGGKTETACFLLTKSDEEVALAGCPVWIHPNADEVGYYRWRLPAPDFTRLVESNTLRPSEEVAMPTNLSALLQAGKLDGGEFVESLARLTASEKQWQTAEGAAGAAHFMGRLAAVDGAEAKAKADEEAYARFIRATFGARAVKLGLEARPREPAGDEQLRPTLLKLVADGGRDQTIRDRAKEITGRWLTDRTSLSVATADTVVPIAAIDGDAALHAGLVTALESAKPAERDTIIGALASFHDPKLLEQTLDLSLTKSIRANEIDRVLFTPQGPRRSIAIRWVRQHFDEIVARSSEDVIADLPRIGAEICEETERDALTAFFTAHEKPGTKRNLAQTTETIDECIRLRRHTAPSIRARLASFK